MKIGDLVRLKSKHRAVGIAVAYGTYRAPPKGLQSMRGSIIDPAHKEIFWFRNLDLEEAHNLMRFWHESHLEVISNGKLGENTSW